MSIKKIVIFFMVSFFVSTTFVVAETKIKPRAKKVRISSPAYGDIRVNPRMKKIQSRALAKKVQREKIFKRAEQLAKKMEVPFISKKRRVVSANGVPVAINGKKVPKNLYTKEELQKLGANQPPFVKNDWYKKYLSRHREVQKLKREVLK